MALPDLIEIVPLDKPVRAEITVPGSKSITNRALILAALAESEVMLEGALWSEDTQVMTEALVKLGFEIEVEPDPDEFCNRRITVRGLGGRIPNTGTSERPLELFVGNAGTAARFLAAMVCLGGGVYRLSGVPRMHERPQAELFKALRELGYRVDSANDRLPAVIYGGARTVPVRSADAQSEAGETSGAAKHSEPLRAGTARGPMRSCSVSINESSQFASALLLSARHGGWRISISGQDDEEMPYVAMTQKLIEEFPWSGGRFQIEPDASSGSYFRGIGWLQSIESPDLKRAMNILGNASRQMSKAELESIKEEGIGLRDWLAGFALRTGDAESSKWIRTHWDSWNEVVVNHWPNSGWQVDDRFFGLPRRRNQLSRRNDLGDSVMTAIVLAPFASDLFKFTDLGRLRVQECERVVALRTELTRCGAKVIEEGDTLTVHPSKLHGAEIETYNDHRMAMCFAILGLKVPGIKLKNPACVKKTFPNFFQKLAAPPSAGLGATILDGCTGRKLELTELFAD